MTPITHVPCGQPVTLKLVIADDLGAAIIYWCERCQTAVPLDECDPPVPVPTEELPPELVLRLIAATEASDREH